MNKQTLEISLVQLGVNHRNYTLHGPPYKDSSWVLEAPCSKSTKDKLWKVFTFERGKRYDELEFDSEDKACAYMYEKLKQFQELMGKFIK